MAPPETIHEYCRSLLESPGLEAKLRPPRQADGTPLIEGGEAALIIDRPVRSDQLRMVEAAGRLPGAGQLKSEGARRSCLARFAHHELQAVELFAWSLLTWPEMPAPLRRSFLGVIEDEQRHTRLYLARLRELGSDLGEEPLSDFFWRHAPSILASPYGPKAFLCAMGLTLEQANLDFALYYRDAFRRIGDEATAKALAAVHQDEIGHVGLAYKWLETLKRPEWSDVEAYDHYVPFPFSASRARGRGFDLAGRERAGLSVALIEHVRRAKHYANKFNQAERGAILLPNLGGEEGESWKRMRFHPQVSRVVSLWRCLFSKDSRVLGDPHPDMDFWPAALGEPPAHPVFPWLEDEGRLVPWYGGAEIEAFCTRRKLRLRLADPAVIERVHDKSFAQALAQERNLLPPSIAERIHVFDVDALEDEKAAYARVEEILACWPTWASDNFTLKPRLGSSGRGRLAGKRGGLDRELLRGCLPRFRERGGLVLEPWLDRVEDLSAQFWIHPGGEVEFLGSLELCNSASGGYRGHRGVMDAGGRVRSGSAFDAALIDTSTRLAEEAACRGYFGPLGVDAFSFRDPDTGEVLLRPLLEANARFTMGIVALGLLHRVCATYAHLTADRSTRRFEFWMDAPASVEEGERFDLSLPEGDGGASGEGPGPALIIGG